MEEIQPSDQNFPDIDEVWKLVKNYMNSSSEVDRFSWEKVLGEWELPNGVILTLIANPESIFMKMKLVHNKALVDSLVMEVLEYIINEYWGHNTMLLSSDNSVVVTCDVVSPDVNNMFTIQATGKGETTMGIEVKLTLGENQGYNYDLKSNIDQIHANTKDLYEELLNWLDEITENDNRLELASSQYFLSMDISHLLDTDMKLTNSVNIQLSIPISNMKETINIDTIEDQIKSGLNVYRVHTTEEDVSFVYNENDDGSFMHINIRFTTDSAKIIIEHLKYICSIVNGVVNDSSE